eukprot:2554944-Rhodomonas_salina.1
MMWEFGTRYGNLQDNARSDVRNPAPECQAPDVEAVHLGSSLEQRAHSLVQEKRRTRIMDCTSYRRMQQGRKFFLVKRLGLVESVERGRGTRRGSWTSGLFSVAANMSGVLPDGNSAASTWTQPRHARQCSVCHSASQFKYREIVRNGPPRQELRGGAQKCIPQSPLVREFRQCGQCSPPSPQSAAPRLLLLLPRSPWSSQPARISRNSRTRHVRIILSSSKSVLTAQVRTRSIKVFAMHVYPQTVSRRVRVTRPQLSQGGRENGGRSREDEGG